MNDQPDRIFDFLYSDHERVASLLSQIEGMGDLKSTHQVSAKSTSSEKKGSVGVPLLKGELTNDTGYNKELRQEYDPLWINSKILINKIEKSQRAKSDNNYSYGDLRVISGKLICMDQSIFNALLSSPSIVGQLSQGMTSDENSNRSSKVKHQEKKDLAAIVREFLQALPLGVVFTLLAENEVFWFNVKREFLQLQTLDIPLKFPFQIGGTWHVAGIIDALPGDYAPDEKDYSIYGDKLILSQGFTIITEMIVPLLQLFGRPAGVHGLNPVSIFRQVSI